MEEHHQMHNLPQSSHDQHQDAPDRDYLQKSGLDLNGPEDDPAVKMGSSEELDEFYDDGPMDEPDQPAETDRLKSDPDPPPPDNAEYSGHQKLQYWIGDGRWQVTLFSACLLNCFFCNCSTTQLYFFQFEPKKFCRPTGFAGSPLNGTQMARLVLVFGWAVFAFRCSPPDESGKPDACLQRQLNYSALVGYDDVDAALAAAQQQSTYNSTTECTSWTFDDTYMTSTVVTQWQLVCGNMWWVEHGVSLNFAGFLIGVLLAGWLSDRFGRRFALLSTALVFVPCCVACSFASNYIVFMALRVLTMIGAMGHAVVIYCYGLEVVGSQWRTVVGGLFFMPYALAYVCVAYLAYLVPDWTQLNLICGGVSTVAIVMCWLIPESPRWLLATGKVKEATRVLNRAAAINRAVIPDYVDFEAIAENIRQEELKKKETQEGMWQMFRHPVLVVRTMILYFVWFVVAMVYYGLSLNVSSFAGNLFVNNAISGAVEIPGYLLTYALLYLGRTRATYGTFFLCAISLGCIAFIENPTLVMVLAMIGKLGVTIAFAVLYVLTCELYPTTIRNTGLSTSSAVARVGTMISPYISGISRLGDNYKSIPMIIFAGCALIAGLSTCALPETLGKRMPEHIEDAVNLGKKQTKNGKKADKS